MDRYLLTLFSKQPRRIRVIENVVRNKRTQATLFWAMCYGILNWLNSDSTLTRKQFDRWLQNQVDEGLLTVDHSVARLTAEGIKVKEEVNSKYYQPLFAQWTWLTNPRQFAERFLLAIQAVSEFKYHNRHYVPLAIPQNEMNYVRNWLIQPHTAEVVPGEIINIATQLEQYDPRLTQLFVHQLVGHGQNGWTSQQAALQLNVAPEEYWLMWRDVWLATASFLKRTDDSQLSRLMKSLIARVPVSDSAWITIADFQKGATIDKIAHQRHLKASTVREHLLEGAIIIPQSVDLHRLITIDEIHKIKQKYGTDVQSWHFRPEHNKVTEFFKFRLCQIQEIHQNHAEP